MRVEDGFQPTPFPDPHPYIDDPILPSLLRRLIPDSSRKEIDADLVRFGHDVGGYIRALSPLVHPPQLTQYDQWGRRIDRLHTSEGWRKLKDIALREGLVAIAHERRYGEHSRIYAFAKIMLWAADSHVIMCPISMTDGAARVLELSGTNDMKRDIRARLISRDPSYAFTSGQWMTEKPGGSDLSQSETTAIPLISSDQSSPVPVGTPYILNGFKWFSSATDSQVTIALARTGSRSLGSRSLSLFLVPLRLPLLPIPDASSISNGIFMHRLKNKFGTHALPTAELSLNNTKAYLLSPLSKGVRAITPVLNITRLHSAVGVVGALSRAFAIARSYATVRNIYPDGSPRLLRDTPIHMSVLAEVATIYHALAHLTFGTVTLLGKSECGTADIEEEVRLRLLTPVVKAFVSDKGVSALEECMVSLGGQGYMEENVIGRLIRDCTVDRIWEGTFTGMSSEENLVLFAILSIDMIRASQADQRVAPFIEWANRTIAATPPILQNDAQLDPYINTLKVSLETLTETFSALSSPPFVARSLLFLFAHLAAALYLLEHAIWAWSNSDMSQETDVDVFKRWVEEGLEVSRTEVERVRAFGDSKERVKRDLNLVYGSSASGINAKL